MRIRLICEGKTKDKRLLALQEDYKARIAHFGEISIQELAPSQTARRSKGTRLNLERQIFEQRDGSSKVVLDERGREWTSDQFAKWMSERALQGARELIFMVGGPEGFPAVFRERADIVLALSRMTLTRDWARTLLLEQIYRAYSIERGYPYPR